MATLAQLPHKKFTRDEVNRLLETDIFAGQRFELMDGELIDKIGQKPPHAYWVTELSAALGKAFGPRRIGTQLPHEVVLAVEVADTTMRHDTNRKRELYAHAGVREYWVLNVPDRKVLVFRNLQNNAYTESLTLSEADALPHIGKSVAEFL
jgi:Uma2 family endonuclease